MLISRLLIATWLAFTACGGQAPGLPSPAADPGPSPTATARAIPGDDDVIVVGASLPLTGSQARQGAAIREGFDVWRDTINQRGGIRVGAATVRVALKYYDDGSNAQTSARMTEKLIVEDNVRLLFGPYGGPATFAASSVSERYQVPLIDYSGGSPAIYNRGFRFVFGILAPVGGSASTILQLALAQAARPHSVALLAANDLLSLDVAKSAEDYARSHGLEVVASEKYPARTKDFAPLLATLKARAPNIVIVSGSTEDAVAVTRQCRASGWAPRLLGFTTGAATPAFGEALGREAEGVVGALQWSPTMSYRGDVFGSAGDYARLFRQRFGTDPDPLSAAASAAGVVLQRAVENAGASDPARVREALAKLEMDTLFGHVKFDDKGENLSKEMALVQWQQGARTLVWPQEVAESPLRYPAVPASRP